MYYAKSDPMESIKEHTDNLLENLKILKETYGDKITENVDMESERFWELMQIICKYHDAGKVFSGFQNQIRKKIGEEFLPTKFDSTIKHEQLSPAFVPVKKYDLTPQEKKLVYQSIFYHHERDILHVNKELIEEILKDEIELNLDKINNELNIDTEKLKTNYLGIVEGQARIQEGDDLYNDYCIMKGLLHRLDHSSSAGIIVEDETKKAVSEYTEKYMNQKGFNKNNLQEFTNKNQNNNLIVIGSTGMGKTESALLWSNTDKTFFTLPLRISINAIFDRIRDDLKYEHVGLLHSTAMDYLEEKDDIENELNKIEMSRNLYEKITTCTIDQIFPFVFKYKGYEKIYATLSYSKIVIDEIQAYSPEIVAIILKGLQMISNLGGKFMIMTATLPRIYKEELEKMHIPFEFNEFIKNIDRHRIQIKNQEIDDDLIEIYKKSQNKKILVIVNTINKAMELYEKLKQEGANVNLLHSRFITKDRNKREEKIKKFSKEKGTNGVWITTQIVEASLDIDFDMLYTEMSTLDSLFQRLGRCYRSREYESKEPNVKIYTENVSGIKYVYDEDIFKKSIELIEKYNGQILKEKIKIDLVDKLYSKELLEGTNFYNKFKEGMKALNHLIDYDTEKKEAQGLLRNIDNIDVIPKVVYDLNLNEFEEYEKEQNYREKSAKRRELNKLFVSINKSNKRTLGSKITECPYLKNKYIIDTKYNDEQGLWLKVDEGYDIESREL